jgi:hypothetical protein
MSSVSGKAKMAGMVDKAGMAGKADRGDSSGGACFFVELQQNIKPRNPH